MTDQYAVIGNPIEHSKSPQIHNAFATETGEEISYIKLLGDLEDFNGDVRDFIAAGGKGLNVTLPFKERAWELVDSCSIRGETSGAINTIIVQDNAELFGENTDGTGLVRDLRDNHRFIFKNQSILIVGAGGAARGVIQPILAQNPHRIVIANRTLTKAEDIAEHFRDLGTLSACALDTVHDQAFDLIINATSAGLSNDVPELSSSALSDSSWVYDMNYNNKTTPFNSWAQQHHAKMTIDGLGMLVEQAAESFYLWRGKRPDTQSVINRLRTL